MHYMLKIEDVETRSTEKNSNIVVPSSAAWACLRVWEFVHRNKASPTCFHSRSLQLGSDLCPLWSLTPPASSSVVVAAVHGDCWCSHRLYNPWLTFMTSNNHEKYVIIVCFCQITQQLPIVYNFYKMFDSILLFLFFKLFTSLKPECDTIYRKSWKKFDLCLFQYLYTKINIKDWKNQEKLLVVLNVSRVENEKWNTALMFALCDHLSENTVFSFLYTAHVFICLLFYPVHPCSKDIKHFGTPIRDNFNTTTINFQGIVTVKKNKKVMDSYEIGKGSMYKSLYFHPEDKVSCVMLKQSSAFTYFNLCTYVNLRNLFYIGIITYVTYYCFICNQTYFYPGYDHS